MIEYTTETIKVAVVSGKVGDIEIQGFVKSGKFKGIHFSPPPSKIGDLLSNKTRIQQYVIFLNEISEAMDKTKEE